MNCFDKCWKPIDCLLIETLKPPQTSLETSPLRDGRIMRCSSRKIEKVCTTGLAKTDFYFHEMLNDVSAPFVPSRLLEEMCARGKGHLGLREIGIFSSEPVALAMGLSLGRQLPL